MVNQHLLHPGPDHLDAVEVRVVARPLHQLDVGPLLKPGHHNLGAVARGSVLEVMVGAMLGHEESKLFGKQLAIPDAIHHSSSFQELQPSLPLQLKLHTLTLGGCLTIFLGNCGVKVSGFLAMIGSMGLALAKSGFSLVYSRTSSAGP